MAHLSLRNSELHVGLTAVGNTSGQDHVWVIEGGVLARIRLGGEEAVDAEINAIKAALAGLCRHSAFEGRRRRVRTNVVVPGLIDTPMGREATRNRPNRTAGQLPLGRQGTAWDIANGVLFLASDEARYITATHLVVDGGLTAARPG